MSAISENRPFRLPALLSYSGKAYSEAVSRQDTETFLRCLENGLRNFGAERISVWDSPHPREKAKNHKTHRKFVRRSTTICHTFASAHFHRFLP
jgi:hypothetical protein